MYIMEKAMSNKLKVFIGWDSREDIAYEVCKYSILKHNPDVEIHPIKQYVMRQEKLYSRGDDKKGSTEFTLTRFLVPYLSNYEGYSLFMDCDMILTDDITKILDEADLSKTLNCVQHNYDIIGRHMKDFKMDGKVQHSYPRKNWSSVMLFNNEKCRTLDLDAINYAEPKWLHRMEWVEDEEITGLHHRWNYLAGYYYDNDYKIIHYTDGGPWFKEYHNCPQSQKWKNLVKEMYGITK